MVAATALFTTVIADAVVGGYKGAPGTPSVVWPAVLRNAGIVAVMTVALGGGQQSLSLETSLIFASSMLWVLGLRLVRKDSDEKTAIDSFKTDGIVIATSFLLVVPLLMIVSQLKTTVLRTIGGPAAPTIGQMSDNVKILLALAILYNNGRGTAGMTLQHLGLRNLEAWKLAALGVAVVLAVGISRRQRMLL
jgi:hypothetical protein